MRALGKLGQAIELEVSMSLAVGQIVHNRYHFAKHRSRRGA